MPIETRQGSVAGRASPRPRRAAGGEAGITLALPLVVGRHPAEITLEAGHCHWLFRVAAYRAILDGRLAPAEPVAARLVAGKVRERHGEVLCLATCAVELVTTSGAPGRIVARYEFARDVFGAFVAARALHVAAAAAAVRAAGGESDHEATGPVEAAAVATATGRGTESGIAFAMHGQPGPLEPMPVAVAALPTLSIAGLRRAATPCGTPASEWVATFVAPAVEAGFDELERASRQSGVEVAGRVHTRVGIDPGRRAFVRVLDRMAITRGTVGTPTSVVTPSASWGDFVVEAGHAITSAHTHLHLDTTAGERRAADPLRVDAGPCISVDDIVTHLTTFADPLAAAVIVSVFPERRVVTIYGHTPQGLLREEPGYWRLEGAHDASFPA